MTSDRVRLHEHVVQHVERELASGRLPVGGRLPAERALAEQLGVSRPSVREGVRVLEALGVVHTAVGSGPESGARVVADTASGITAALRLHLASRTLPVADVVRTRTLMESWAVREAARLHNADALAMAAALLDEMDAPNLTAERFHDLDTDFHIALTKAADNVVVSVIMTALRESIKGYILEAIPRLDDWPKMARLLRRQHRAVYAAVTRGESERAARLVSNHIEGFHRATQIDRGAGRYE